MAIWILGHYGVKTKTGQPVTKLLRQPGEQRWRPNLDQNWKDHQKYIGYIFW